MFLVKSDAEILYFSVFDVVNAVVRCFLFPASESTTNDFIDGVGEYAQ